MVVKNLSVRYGLSFSSKNRIKRRTFHFGIPSFTISLTLSVSFSMASNESVPIWNAVFFCSSELAMTSTFSRAISTIRRLIDLLNSRYLSETPLKQSRAYNPSIKTNEIYFSMADAFVIIPMMLYINISMEKIIVSMARNTKENTVNKHANRINSCVNRFFTEILSGLSIDSLSDKISMWKCLCIDFRNRLPVVPVDRLHHILPYGIE